MAPQRIAHVIAAVTVMQAVALAQPVAHAQSYPVKPVRVVVAWPPGGSNDVVARVMAQRLTESLGHPFVVENRGGATGTIGSDVVAKSPPDGHTILVTSATHVANPHVYKKLPYDTMRDFTGIMPLAVQIGMLVVHPSLPVHSVKELIELAKARPNEIAWASTGSGSYTWLTMALLLQMTGTKMLEVNYKGGGPATIALASGEVQAFFVGIGSLTAALPAKRVRPLGVASDKRLKQYPDIPTIAETIPGYEMTAWVGAFVPSATSRAIVDRLNAEFRKALDHPDVSRILGAQTLDPMPMTAEEFAQRLKTDYDKYEKLIKATGARTE
ncbi:MAG: Bug family tripartite tricarboxylate transporter substrate binding protein [Burkholderiales bacterium]